MAKIETTFIRPKEEFNVDTGKAKVVYDGYQNNPHEIELKENLDGDVEGVINDTFKENDNNNVAFTDNEGDEHELITSEGFGDALNEALPAALANAQVIKTTWSELKALRDGGNLIAGSLYRITDYNCTTIQENTRSAGHQFDIVLLALSVDKLAEEGWAMMNESNIYDVTFGDGVTKKCYLYGLIERDEEVYNIVDVDTLLGNSFVSKEAIIINEETKTATISNDSNIDSTKLTEENLTYNYFQNSNLSAWKVWYCLDNDTDRFAWADDSVDESTPAILTLSNSKIGDIDCERDSSQDIEGYYAWTSDEYGSFYTNTLTPTTEDNVYNDQGDILDTWSIVSYTPAHEGTGIPNGRGVIYRLIDEFNNDVAYDFKNIQYVRPLTDGEYDADHGEDTWVYTLNNIDEQPYDASLNTIAFDNSANNKIDSFYTFINDKNYFMLPDIVILYGGGYNNISVSQIITILQNVVKMQSCQDCVIGNADSQFYICDTVTTTESDDPAIYINNKKVLTEE